MNGEKEIKKAYESILDHDFEKAIEWFEQAVALNPGKAEYHFKLSITYARSGKLEKALEHANRAVEIEDENQEYRFHLQHLQALDLIRQAEACLRATEDQAYLAVSLLKRAIAFDPLNVEGHLLLGLAYAQLTDYAEAIQSVKEASKLDPQNEIAQKMLEELKAKLQAMLKPSQRKG